MKNKSYKHILILIIQCLLIGASVGLAINSVGVFYPSVSKSLNVLNGSFAAHTTIQLITTATFSLFIPKILEKYSIKSLFAVGMIGLSLTTIIMGFSNSLYVFYLLGFLRGIFSSFCGTVPVSFVINNWFYKYRGIALSVAFGFSGLLGAIFSPILSKFIIDYGWQNTYIIKGIIMFVLCIPSIIIPFSINPKDENLLAFGYDNEKIEVVHSNSEFNYFNLLFILFFIFSFICSTITGLPQHFIGYTTSINLLPEIGAKMLSFTMIGNIVFKVVIGFLNDMIGTIKSVITFIIINALSIIFIVVFKQYYIGAFLLGSVYAIAAVGSSLLSTQFFTSENYLKVFPVVSFSGILGNAVSLSLVGYLFDFTGSYYLAFIIAFAINIINIFIILYITSQSKKMVK